MNIFRPQVPYVFHPPRYTRWMQPVIKYLSEQHFLKRLYKITDIRVEGAEDPARLTREGHAVLVAPNHADHADPHVLHYAGRRAGMALHFMAAREGFEKSRRSAFLLQRAGAFSVDREGADLQAVKTAIRILSEGAYPLVMFPEGEIWHHHETLDVLNEGVATILLRAAAKTPKGKQAYLVPAGLRYSYSPEVEHTFSARMSILEESIRWKPRPELDIVKRIYRFGGGMLAAKEVELLGAAQQGSLLERVQSFQKRLVASLEERYGAAPSGDPTPDRVRRLRKLIRTALTDGDQPPDAAHRRVLYDDLDTLFVAIQLYSYPVEYLEAQPTRNRIAETLLKLEEDVLGEGRYPTDRTVDLRFGKPLCISEFLESEGLTNRGATAPLTAWLSTRIQELVRAH